MRRFFLFILFSGFLFAHAQEDYGWWVQIHNWDGITPWYQYLKMTPEYLGPNALPVPEIQKGFVGNKATLELAADGHFSKGDKTQNFFTKLYYPLVPKIVAIEGYVVPIEHYAYDTITRDIRASRDRDGKGIAGGDIYFGTIVQLVKDKKFPDMALRLSMRTASGTKVSAARYTDAPGYFFDLSLGKESVSEKNELRKFRWYLMIGFYSWQTNSGDYRQDDAFLYGAGADFTFSKVTLSPCMGGYFGYINNHDRPVVARFGISRNSGKNIFGLRFQKGISDFPYTTAEIFFRYTLPDAWLLYKPSI